MEVVSTSDSLYINVSISGTNHTVGFEASDPVLRGQSGGPVFDSEGVIWGMQALTMHHYLGFDVEKDIRKDGLKKRIKNNAFLHVGLCVHAEIIKDFMCQNGVRFSEV